MAHGYSRRSTRSFRSHHGGNGPETRHGDRSLLLTLRLRRNRGPRDSYRCYDLHDWGQESAPRSADPEHRCSGSRGSWRAGMDDWSCCPIDEKDKQTMRASFIHMADTHLGYEQYGVRERFNDFSRTFWDIIDDAIERHVDFVVIAGDLFNKRAIDALTLIHAIEGLRKLKDRNI